MHWVFVRYYTLLQHHQRHCHSACCLWGEGCLLQGARCWHVLCSAMDYGFGQCLFLPSCTMSQACETYIVTHAMLMIDICDHFCIVAHELLHMHLPCIQF